MALSESSAGTLTLLMPDLLDFRSLGHGDIKFEDIIVALNDIATPALSIEWEDGRMDRVHGGTEAAAFTRKVDFKPNAIAFDCLRSNESIIQRVNQMQKRKIRMGMVGGGQGAFIGGVHRIAAAIDQQIELVCGAFSSDPERSKASGKDSTRRKSLLHRLYDHDGPRGQAARRRANGLCCHRHAESRSFLLRLRQRSKPASMCSPISLPPLTRQKQSS